MTEANTRAVLQRLADGDDAAAGELLPRVYDELRGLAAGMFLARDRSPTLPPTALVHEAYLRLAGAEVDCSGRTHFVALAAKVMRQVLIDHHRERGAQKRGGGWDRITLGGLPGWGAEDQLDFLALHDALEELAELDERQARVVELRFFGGLGMQEIADVLRVSVKTVEVDWRHARAWLTARLENE